MNSNPRDQHPDIDNDLRSYFAQVAEEPVPTGLEDRAVSAPFVKRPRRILSVWLGGGTLVVAAASIAVVAVAAHNRPVAAPIPAATPTATAVATPAPTPTAVPTPVPTPVATPVPTPLPATAAEILAVAKETYWQDSNSGTPFVGQCGFDGHYSKCPFTASLTQRLLAIEAWRGAHSPAGFNTLCVCQMGKQHITFATTVTATGGTVVARASWDSGETNVFTLTIVRSGSKLLVNDITFNGSGSTCTEEIDFKTPC